MKRTRDASFTRSLNRALLARQLLLKRSTMPVADAIEHLVGLQAQAPHPPYYHLHSRLENFQHETLSQLMRDRAVVRIALMRSTIHMVTARDCLVIRALMQPTLERAAKGSFAKRLVDMDFDALAQAARDHVALGPRTFKELGAHFQERWPDRDRDAMTYAARALVPLVQLPPRGLWGEGGLSVHGLVDSWLAAPLSSEARMSDFIVRYLRAFGPASVMDMQAWSGMKRLGDHFEQLRASLHVMRDADGREYFDVIDAPRPPHDTRAPTRFLGEYDNILLAHADRSRMIAESHRKRIYTANGIVRATILVDGFVAGQWRIAKEGKRATMMIEPFTKLNAEQKQALKEESVRLLSFVAPDFTYATRFVRALP